MDMNDLELVTWLEEKLRSYKTDFEEDPLLEGGRYSYAAIFGITLRGQVMTVHALRLRAEKMLAATPWADDPRKAESWLRLELHGWREVVIWADDLYTKLSNEK